MTRDFAKNKKAPAKKAVSKADNQTPSRKRKANTRKPKEAAKKAPLWAWGLTGVCIITFAAFLSKLSQTSPQAQTTSDTNKSVELEKTPKGSSQVRFDFYTILKEKEVEVNPEVIESPAEAKNIVYWLQAGSFKNPDDANKVKAQLLLKNLPASVEETTNKDGQLWYRTMIGPFASRSRLAKARSILASVSIKSIVIKRQQEP